MCECMSTQEGAFKMVEEEKIYQFAYNWAVHVWTEAEAEYSKYKHVEVLKENEQDAWQTLMAIKKIAQSKGYTL